MLAATREIGTAFNLPGFWHYHCAAHVLNLAVGAAFNTRIIPRLVKNYVYLLVQ